MRIRLLCVGKPKEASLIRLHDRYAERLERLGVRYAAEWVKDVTPGGRFTDQHALEREAGQLLERLTSKETVVATAIDGELLSSPALADRLDRWSARGLTLLVGGPLGLHERVLERADHRWSLSPLTFPHEMVRVLVAEQVYRALGIRRGSPYHK